MEEKIQETEGVIGRFFIGVLIIIFLLGFIVSLSISQNMKNKNVNKIAADIIKEELSKQIAANIQLSPEEIIKSAVNEEGDVDYAEAYSFLIEECKVKNAISFENFEYKLQCDELETIQLEDFENFVKTKFNERIQEEINKKIHAIDFNDIYAGLLKECEGKESIYLENFDYNLNCNSLKELGPEEFESFIEQEINKKLVDVIEQQLKSLGLTRFLPLINVFVWFFALLVGIMVFLLFLMSFYKYKFVFDLGLSMMIAGLPFFAFINMKLTLKENPILGTFLSSILETLFRNLLIVFILGIAILIIGIIMGIIKKKKKEPKKDINK